MSILDANSAGRVDLLQSSGGFLPSQVAPRRTPTVANFHVARLFLSHEFFHQIASSSCQRASHPDGLPDHTVFAPRLYRFPARHPIYTFSERTRKWPGIVEVTMPKPLPSRRCAFCWFTCFR